MLSLLTNFLSPENQIMFDKTNNKGYLLIQKCGTQSLLNLTNKFPEQYCILTSKQFLETNQDTLTVFIREPIDRYISGMITQMQLYQIPQLVFERMLNIDQQVPMFDTHTMPQFWFLLRFGLNTTLKFKIVDLQDMYKIHSDIKKLNGRKPIQNFLNNVAMNKIDYAMTEDIVLHTQFLGKTITIQEVLDQISKEKTFFSEVNQYKNILPYIGDSR